MTKRILIAFLAALSFTTGCIHDKFDEPPGGGTDPDIDANLIISIFDLKELYNGGDAVEITDSVFISGIVIADDRSGNYYQTVVLEDGTAGISVRLETADYYNEFPIGRRLFILMKGLYLGNYGGLVQAGVQDIEETDGVERIPNLLVRDHFFPGKYGLNMEPEEVTIEDLEADRDAYQNRLIKLMNVEFGPEEFGKTLATDPDLSSAQNRNIYDCDNNSIILRTSSYSEFALEPISESNGSLTAIFSVFNSDNQLIIRELSDINFDNVRCSEQPIECNDVQTARDGELQDFESAPVFDPIDLDNWQSISVVGNEPWEARSFSGNTYAQAQGFGASTSSVEMWLVSPKMNFDAAQTLSFESKIGFWKHNGLKVFISTDFDGCNVASATWTELTDAVIADNILSPDGVSGYAANFVNSGNVDLSAYSGEGFIGFRYVGDNSTNTTTYQLDNIQIGDPPPVVCDVDQLDEDFETISAGSGVNFVLECWQNVATVGNELWEGRSFSSNKYAQISGFSSPSATIETYLITPPIDLSGVSTLTFDTKIGFCVHDGLKVYISTNYDGSNVAGATWTELTSAVIADSDCSGQYAASFVNSGNVDISAYSGTGYIAFVYRGNNTTETTTYQVDNVSVQ